MLIYAEIEGETIMSQQRMDFDETNRQRQEPPFDNYGTGYRDPFMSSYAGQKLSSQGTSGSSGATPGMRVTKWLTVNLDSHWLARTHIQRCTFCIAYPLMTLRAIE